MNKYFCSANEVWLNLNDAIEFELYDDGIHLKGWIWFGFKRSMVWWTKTCLENRWSNPCLENSYKFIDWQEQNISDRQGSNLSPIKKKSHQLYKKKKTIIAKLIGSLNLLSATVASLGLYQATELNSPGLVLFSAVFTILFVVLSICYFAMDPKEKYRYV